MRQLLMTAALTFLTLAPLRAFGQAQEDEDVQGTSGPEGSSSIVPEKPNSKRTPSTTGKASSPGTQHTVERGDTLWDLSQRFLGSPWYWPKVWSYNPEIANPHWIYPGNEVRFFGTGDEVPTQVEVGQPQMEVEQGEFYEEKINVSGPIGFVPKRTVSVVSPGFVTTKEVEESGRITGSFAETSLLSYPDLIYVQFAAKAPRLGETYIVFRNGGEVIHPVTRSPMGYMTTILAEVRVIRVDGNKRATVQISKQYDEVARGDFIGPFSEPVMRAVGARPNEREIKNAYIVAEVHRFLGTLGEHSMVIVDKGSEDGVKTGNVFTIFRQHDPLPIDVLLRPTTLHEEFPREDIARCIAFEVKAKATICLLSASMREVGPGDHAEVRTSGSGSRAAR